MDIDIISRSTLPYYCFLFIIIRGTWTLNKLLDGVILAPRAAPQVSAVASFFEHQSTEIIGQDE
jgi:hypothetical protein